jgi:hypothetical protein
MGRLTEDMARLCGEIVTLRGTRESFVVDLRQDVASMIARFRRTHSEKARMSKEKRLADLSGLRQTVAAMKSGFRRSHANMAWETQRGRLSFVAGLKQTTSDMLHEYALDIGGAHRAWFGPSLAELQAMATAERRTAEARIQAEEERKAREQAEQLRAAEIQAEAEESVSVEPDPQIGAVEPESVNPEPKIEPQKPVSMGHEHRSSGRKKR